jgi:copper oxidase (laccase) domain-containing protein
MAPFIVSNPKITTAAQIHSMEVRSKMRLSTTSATAPAGIASKKNGRYVAVCTSDTITGDGASEVINHD